MIRPPKARLRAIARVSTFPLAHGAARSDHYCKIAMVNGDSNALAQHFKAAGVGTSVHYPAPAPLAKYYRERYGHTDAEFPAARWISDSMISLPVGTPLDEEDMHLIADRLERAIAECRT